MATEQIAVVAHGREFGKDEGETVGYYGHKRRKVGQTFVISRSDFPVGPKGDELFQNAFSERWMDKLSDKESKAVKEEAADKAADAARKGKTKQPQSVL